MIHKPKVGILGGGQLGSMLIRSAIDYGINVSVMDADPNAPSSRYTSSFTCGDPGSYEDVMAFGASLDILTIEKEDVNIEALKALESSGVKVHPSPAIIEIIQDKYTQKEFLLSNLFPVVPGILIENRSALKQHTDKLPGCLKKCKSGYDGYGVMMIHTTEDISKAFEEPSVLEDLVAVKHEISVIVSRNEAGAVRCYDPVMMVFNKERFVLDFQVCPANIPVELSIEASGIAIRIAEALGLVGILAVEMFITEDGKLLVNELAPRAHNSGHHTIEASVTSQYEQQLRAILGLAPGDTKLTGSSVMINILEPSGDRIEAMHQALKELLEIESLHMHWYGKKSGRPGRKVGHITISDPTMEGAISKAAKARHILKNINE
ncbi:MAG: 5-(carboxyamino)imidazole ribonucleotide synthase [Sphingobacteriales bacterium]|nr:MAG: 5-(carboxyamino)imidazole ribonucleotide synthase [Sphingobacteriales bacterium]